MFLKSILLAILLAPLTPTPVVDERVRATEEYIAWEAKHEEYLQAVKVVADLEKDLQEAKAARTVASLQANGAYQAWLNAENAYEPQ